VRVGLLGRGRAPWAEVPWAAARQVPERRQHQGGAGVGLLGRGRAPWAEVPWALGRRCVRRGQGAEGCCAPRPRATMARGWGGAAAG